MEEAERLIKENQKILGDPSLIESMTKNPLFWKRFLIKTLPQGKGSGLDADTVDGYHADDFLRRISETHRLAGMGGGGGVSDHGALTGLPDDDHTQYYDAARHTKAVHDALGIDAATLDGNTTEQVQDHVPPDLSVTMAKLAADVAALVSGALQKSGGTMTGTLDIITVSPTLRLFDTLLEKWLTLQSIDGGGAIITDGDVLHLEAVNRIETSVPILLPDDPTENLHAATKGYVDDNLHSQIHAIDGADHTGTLDDDQFEGAAETKSNKTPDTIQTQWAAKTGTARKVLVYDTATGKPAWDWLKVYEVLSPAQILTFTMSGNGTGDDAVVSNQKLWGRNAGTWNFAMTYEGTPTAATIDSDTENSPSDYPVTVTTPFTSKSGTPAINSPAAVNSVIIWTLAATVSGENLTKTVTCTYRNRRHWGTNPNTSYTSEFINAEDNEELTNSRVKTFTVTAAEGEYIWYSYPSRLGEATFKVGGFTGGFEAYQLISHTNDGGKTENYYAYRSTQPSLGTTEVVVT